MASTAVVVLRRNTSRRLYRRVATVAAAVAVAGFLAGAHADRAMAATSNPTPSAGARNGATRLPFSVSGTSSLSVDVGTGNALFTDQLLTLPGRRSDAPITLSYNSSAFGSSAPSAVTNSTGSGWAISGFDERMVTNSDSSVTFYGPQGLSGVFTPSGTGFTSPSQFKADLSGSQSAGYTLTFHASREKLSFNGSGRLTSDADRDGNTTSYSYDPYSGYPTSIVSSRGPAASRTVNVTTTNGRITQLSQSSAGVSRTVQFQYTSGGHLSTVIDTAGYWTQFASPSGTDTGQVVQITGPIGAATTLTFDSSSRVTTVNQSNSPTDGGTGDATTRLSYTSSTQTLVADPTTDQSQAVPSVPHTTYTIDSSSHLVTHATDPVGNSRSAGYNPFGDVSSSTNAAGGNTTFSYPSGTNNGESLTSIANPGGATESASYSNSGSTAYLPSSTTDDASNALKYSYDGNGNQTGTAQGASGPQAKVDYNGDGTPKDSTSPGATAMTTYSYGNGDGDLTSITPPSNSSLGSRAYGYDGYGRLLTATDGKGDTITYTYDDLDRIVNVGYSDGTHAVVYTYDRNGHVVKRVDGSGTTTYTYDDLGHLLTVRNTANNNLITYTYDLSGALASVTDGLGTTSYKYDSAHELTEMDYPQGGVTLSTYFKNNNGKRTDVWLQASGGTTSAPTAWAAHEQYTYDSSGRITKVLAQQGPATGPTTVENETLCYQAGTSAGGSCPSAASTDRGNIQWTSESVSGETNAYTYDDHNRLTKDAVTGGSNPRTYTYGYDNSGNRTSSSVTGSSPSSQSLAYNDGNQISTTGYTYDGAGNLTTSPARKATYNAAGQQTSATVSGVTSSYSYAGTNSDEVLTENVPNDHNYTLTYGRPDKNGLPTIDSANVSGFGTGYILSDPSGQPVMLQTSGGNTDLYVYDGTHNPVVVSTSYQTTAISLRYDPYGGETRTDSNGLTPPWFENPYTYGEGIRDRATGEIKFGQRFYNPATGNWTQQDALNAPLDPKNANRYVYAADNPINASDPTGRDGILDTIGGALVGAAAGFDLGSSAGPIIGAAVGSFFGPEGLAIGAEIGGAVGANFGTLAGGAAGGIGADIQNFLPSD